MRTRLVGIKKTKKNVLKNPYEDSYGYEEETRLVRKYRKRYPNASLVGVSVQVGKRVYIE